MSGKTIQKAANKSGTVFALVADGAAWSVLKLCSNYDGRVRGGIRKTWRWDQKGLSESVARELFARRLAGTQR